MLCSQNYVKLARGGCPITVSQVQQKWQIKYISILSIDDKVGFQRYTVPHANHSHFTACFVSHRP